MSKFPAARVALFTALIESRRSEEASALINAYAHELAEKIRLRLADVQSLEGTSWAWRRGYEGAIKWAANSIDPEVDSK